MTIGLVTGGAGFIGYHLAKYILAKGFKVIIYDNFSDYYSPKIKWRNAQDLQKLGAMIVEGDILDREKLTETITKIGENSGEECEFLFHLAAQAGVRYSTKNPERTLRINIEGTSNILRVAREIGIRRVIFASSSSVFGPHEYLPIDENHPKKPISFYGASKLAAEKLIEVERYLFPDISRSIIRPFTVVGARQRPDMAINIFVSKALKGETIKVYGDGEQTRDWTHVENMAQAFHLAAIKKEAMNEDFNIGAGTRISVNKILEMVAEITGKELRIEHVQFDKADVKDTFANISKAKNLLGYQPKKTIQEAIQEFADYWQKEKPWKL